MPRYLKIKAIRRDTDVLGVLTKLRTLISRDMATERRRDRDRKRDKARRRAAGAVDRATYEANSATRQKPWEALGMSRRSWYRAGKPAAPADGTSPCVLQAEAGK